MSSDTTQCEAFRSTRRFITSPTQRGKRRRRHAAREVVVHRHVEHAAEQVAISLHLPAHDAAVAHHHSFRAARGELGGNGFHEDIERVRVGVEVVGDREAKLWVRRRARVYVVA